jgi:hypothetical protein
MKFYKISHDSHHTRGTPWFSGGLVPLKSQIVCEKCGRSEVAPHPVGHISLEIEPQKGTFWPDALGQGGSPVGLYISDRAKAAWDRFGIKYGSYCEVDIYGKFPKKLINADRPKYYYIIPNLGATLDWKRSGFEHQGICPNCGRESLGGVNVGHPLYFIENSWRGDDVFSADRSTALRFCTQKVVDLAEKEGLTNFRFTEIGDPIGSSSIEE